MSAQEVIEIAEVSETDVSERCAVLTRWPTIEEAAALMESDFDTVTVGWCGLTTFVYPLKNFVDPVKRAVLEKFLTGSD